MAAFVFDIDGVLSKGSQPLPGAKEALQVLQARNIPFIFLTNGGGLTEEAHVDKLRVRLGLEELDENQFIQSHTPYRALVPEYGDRTILALGGHSDKVQISRMPMVFESKHGRKDPISPLDISTDGSESGESNDGLLRIHAILVWNSPRDWCLDLQVVLDLLLSVDGIVGTRSPKNGDATLPNGGYLQDGQPRLFFSNPDFEWATQHAQPPPSPRRFSDRPCAAFGPTRQRGLAQPRLTGVGSRRSEEVYARSPEAWNGTPPEEEIDSAYTIKTVFI
ncbi:phosphatidyl synthase [Verticillium alfalfae VaMs.102]|uniref:Phosphatidyl synthase n=1 Tax=Verticillium alfalfae (strain VaMs.102 / ATCC MYA-4576 / FGSC 10136) TaxID=526221 RepID=C9S6R5_VERA1|nr:phosphatidyl synthase [Verticillium alfalfae VaMs.102]EEY15168.1 phosphatidyl synthase [Verticillium alfalfae VaMs.102]